MTDGPFRGRFGTGAREPPSERVRLAIAAEQDRSEILIGWIQLAVVAAFAALYAATPRQFYDSAAIEPVPWVLAVYAFFTVARLVAAYRMRLPPWVLALSVVVDMGLLFGLIWTFHIQYAQPPSFYLKAPTLLYVFIFVALRALRFEAAYVILAGVVAALGWVVMVGYASLADGGVAMITRDYVEYMTTNAILLGAEFDKIVSILLVTAILAVGISRGRRLLERAVTEGTAAADLSRFFAPEIADRITHAEETMRAGEGIARDAAILFVDIRGFSRRTAAIPPERTVALLAEYHARLVPVIDRHGGVIDKFLGDGIMASFGATHASARYAAEALEAVDALLEEVRHWNGERTAASLDTIVVNMAVHAGTVVVGAVGGRDRLEFTLIGAAVNEAARIEKHNKRLGTRALATRHIHDLAIEQGYESRAPALIEAIELPDMAETVDLVILAR